MNPAGTGLIVTDWIAHRAAVLPDAPAVIGSTGVTTYRQLDALVEQARGSLADLGVARRTRVGILAANSLSFVVLVHALVRIGAILVPLNTRLTDLEVRYQIENAAVSVLLVDETNGERIIGREVSPATRGASLDDIVSTRVESLIRVPGSLPTISLQDWQGILHTSGTTGSPRGAVITNGNHWWSACASSFNLGVGADDRWLLTLPAYHIGGLSILFRAAIYGIGVVLQPRFDPEAVWASISSDRVTIVSLVPTMLERLLEGDAPREHALRCVLLGGAAAPPALLARAAKRGIPVVQTYGLTECCSQVATLAPADALSHPGSAGKPLLGVDLRIDRDDSTDGAGQILVRGPTVSPGYCEGETIRPIVDADGWFPTGDYGRIDPNGYLYVLDRRVDLIVSGGENVYPAEVEAILRGYGDVQDACVVARVDPTWGQVPVCALTTRGAPHPELAENLTAYCRERLAPFKIPRAFRVVGELPRTSTGKLRRGEIRRWFGDAP